MQVDPTKPTLKPLGRQLLKLKYDKQLSNFAFKFNLRRYIMALPETSNQWQFFWRIFFGDTECTGWGGAG